MSSPDDAEHVDVCVVSGKVDEGGSGSSVQPQVLHQFLQSGGALLFGLTQVPVVPRSTVGGQQAPVRGTVDFFLRVVGPSAGEQDNMAGPLLTAKEPP